MATDLTGRTDILMLQVELDGASRASLLSRFPKAHPGVKADHMTVAFRPSESMLSSFEVGKKVTLHVVGYAEDSRGQAVVVAGFPSSNEIPHITISVADGTKPVYSNKLLADGYDSLDGDFVLTGTTVAVTKKMQKIST